MSSLFGAYDPTQGTYSASQISAAPASTNQSIVDAEQASRQAYMNMGMGPGYAQGVDPSVYQTLYSTNPQGQVVRNSDGYAAPGGMANVQNPNAAQYYKQNPQELFALGALGGAGGQGYFMDAGVRGTDKKLGQLTPDQYYRGYTSSFADGWDSNNDPNYRWAGQDSQPQGQNGAQPRMQPGLYLGGNGQGAGGPYGGIMAGAGYSGASGSSTSSTGTSGLNPYLTQAQQAIAGQVTDNLNRNILPGINSSAASVGGYGGSRQGVVQANALNDANRQIANGMANLSFNAYESDQGRQLQRYGIDTNYNLGMTNANNSFYTSQRGQDLQSTALGAQLMNQGNSNYLGAGSGVANLGTSAQQAPWQVMGNYTGAISPFTGYGATTTNSQNSNSWAQALGGAMAGGQIGKLF